MGYSCVELNKGLRGLGAEDDREIVIRDDAQSFADAMLTLASDRDRRRLLAERAWVLLSERYDRAKSVSTKASIYQHLCASEDKSP